jgi:acetyltransferase
VKVGIVLSSGFAETGAQGHAVQDRIAARARAAGMRLVGPNCMGVVSHLGDGNWLNGSYFWAVPKLPEDCRSASQSLGGMFFSHAPAASDSRFWVVMLQTVGHRCANAGDDPGGAIGLFVEGIDDGRRCKWYASTRP